MTRLNEKSIYEAPTLEIAIQRAAKDFDSKMSKKFHRTFVNNMLRASANKTIDNTIQDLYLGRDDLVFEDLPLHIGGKYSISSRIAFLLLEEDKDLKISARESYDIFSDRFIVGVCITHK